MCLFVWPVLQVLAPVRDAVRPPVKFGADLMYTSLCKRYVYVCMYIYIYTHTYA